MKRPYIVGALAVASLVAVAAVPLPHLAHGDTPVLSGQAVYSCCTDFRSLTKRSVIVVRARVTAMSPSYFLPPDRPVFVKDPPPQLPPDKATAVALDPPPTVDANATPPADPNPGLLVTDATVQVVQTLRGSVQPGQTLTVEQVGGTDPQGQQWVDEANPLLQVGQEEILFLMPTPTANGKYATIGGPQGRFSITSTGLVQSRAPATWGYLKAYNGLTADALKVAVTAAAATP